MGHRKGRRPPSRSMCRWQEPAWRREASMRRVENTRPRARAAIAVERERAAALGANQGPGLFVDVDGNHVRLLRDGREVYPAMLDAIARAKREILLEMYWFQGDKAGLLFRDA